MFPLKEAALKIKSTAVKVPRFESNLLNVKVCGDVVRFQVAFCVAEVTWALAAAETNAIPMVRDRMVLFIVR